MRFNNYFFQEKFGDDIDIIVGKKKIGMKYVDEYLSDVDIDDFVNDSDFDVEICRLIGYIL